MKRTTNRLFWGLFLTLFLFPAVGNHSAGEEDPAEKQYTQIREGHLPKIAQYEAESVTNPPPPGCTMFVGSSTWTGWGKTFDKDFAGMNAVNRGFGGAIIPEWLLAMDTLVTPHKPARIFFFCGTNDVAAGHSAQRVTADFQAFLAKLRETNPDCKVFFVSATKTHSRRALWPKMDELNAAVAELAETDPRLTFLDLNAVMYGENGEIREELYQADRLHLNREGQKVWIPVLRKAYEDSLRGQL